MASIPVGWNSTIVPEFPKLFEYFEEKQFTLLWRGSRDGFRARDFHSRCDCHANTLTMISDTEGNTFAGFTPVEWELGLGHYKVPARRFALKAEKKPMAINGSCWCGPDFGDIGVSNICNANTDSNTSEFGNVYTNDTGLEGKTFFTGSWEFQVKEIEVFEITN
jgi:hypothetical protein